jgi:hypothetical protein
MTIYLCVKTHTITGLKYLCKTKSKDPHKYSGSGTYWKAHLKVHRKEHTTEILKECTSNEEIKQWGLHYSELWDVVNARDKNNKKLWANLKPESGDGGFTSPWNKGKKIGPASLESKAKNSASNNGNKNGRFGKGILKSSTVNMRKPKSDSHAENISIGRIGLKYKRLSCPHCNNEFAINLIKRYHLDNCKLKK